MFLISSVAPEVCHKEVIEDGIWKYKLWDFQVLIVPSLWCYDPGTISIVTKLKERHDLVCMTRIKRLPWKVVMIAFLSLSVQFSSVTQSHPTLCDPVNRSTPGLPVRHQLPESTQTHVHWVGDAIHHLILCHPLFLLPSIFPSISVFSNESALHMKWPKYWSFSFNISPSNEHTELISVRMDGLALLAVQGTLKSLLQHHKSKASILKHWPFFIVPTLTSIHDHWQNHSLD